MDDKKPESPTLAEEAVGKNADSEVATDKEQPVTEGLDDFRVLATRIFEHGAQGILLTIQDVQQLKATNDEIIALLAQAMPSEGNDQDARQFFEKQIRLLDELYGRIRALPERVFGVYGKSKEINQEVTKIQLEMKRELALIDRNLPQPEYTALALKLAVETLNNEPIIQSCLPGFAALPLTKAVENYEAILTAFLGRPAGSLGLKQRAKAAFDLIRADAVKTGVNFFIPRTMLILDLARAVTTSAFDKDVIDLSKATPIMSKLLKLERTGLNLLSSFALIEDLIAQCLAGIEGSGEIMKRHFLMAVSVLETIPRKLPVG
jgi:hypothetical protein